MQPTAYNVQVPGGGPVDMHAASSETFRGPLHILLKPESNTYVLALHLTLLWLTVAYCYGRNILWTEFTNNDILGLIWKQETDKDDKAE